MPDVRGMIDLATDKGRAMADCMVKVQAQIIAFSHDYQMVMIFTLCAIPLAIMIGSTKATLRAAVGRAGSCGDRVAGSHRRHDAQQHRPAVVFRQRAAIIAFTPRASSSR